MLRSLEIRDILLIERAELEFRAGLNVLTGETGAGKSILLDCLGLALGRRGRAELVRAGAARGVVTAVFEPAPGHGSEAILEEAGIAPDESGALILRRVASPDGRKTAFVNDQRASGETLRRLGESLMEIHGQHDDRGLLDPKGHGALLDAFAGPDAVAAAAETGQRWREASAAARALDEARAARADAERDADYLRHAAGELAEIAPVEGEDERLDAERRLMRGADKLRADLIAALGDLGGEGAERALADAIRRLEAAADRAEGALDPALTALERVMNELAEAQAATSAALDAVTFDPGALEITEERLFALRALARKHAVGVDDLPALAAEMTAKVEALDGSGARLDALEAAATEARARYLAAAEALSALRRAAAGALEEAVERELAPLRMERAVFRVAIDRLDEAEAGPAGLDRAAFRVATAPGAPDGPIDRIASGGELSRFLLALKVNLARAGEPRALIFDEIDRGVGGATADAVGRRLARLAETAQVLAVTHSPQVAARGAHHWLVSKVEVDAGAATSVAPLEGEARVEEIGRMLAGAEITAEALAAARRLIEG